jgi:hypothetical protein
MKQDVVASRRGVSEFGLSEINALAFGEERGLRRRPVRHRCGPLDEGVPVMFPCPYNVYLMETSKFDASINMQVSKIHTSSVNTNLKQSLAERLNLFGSFLELE